MIMAERRMLAKSIIESDAFSDMPVEAQMLYVRLNLAADDDGFVSNPRSIMRMCGASNDSMVLLINKKFILAFEKGDNFVYLIKHWRIHNYIQSDRKKASTFRELLRGVYYDENKAYTMTPGEGKIPVMPPLPDTNRIQDVSNMDTNCIQPASKPDTQDRLGKDSIDKVSVDKDRIGEGGLRGEQAPTPGPVEKLGEQIIIPDPDKKRERIDFFIGRLQFFEQQGWDGECWYTMAAAEGITKGEIDLRKIQLEKQKEAEKK